MIRPFGFGTGSPELVFGKINECFKKITAQFGGELSSFVVFKQKPCLVEGTELTKRTDLLQLFPSVFCSFILMPLDLYS